MNLFDVYPRYSVEIEKASGTVLTANNGENYMDFYGGHGVISIGHSHPHYVKSLKEQLDKIGFYSNVIQNTIQDRLADKLGSLSGYASHSLFLCNSGAEAIENALKLASFHSGRSTVLAFEGSFHGRTAAAMNVTYHMKQRASINESNFPTVFVPLNDEVAVNEAIAKNNFAAIIVEGIQGVGGLDQPSHSFLTFLRNTCDANGIVLIVDEIQSGYGRSGKFFAHQHSGIEADLITVAKGMGNGFPIAGVLINPKIQSQYGLLATTFGGNHLACAAALAVLEVIEKEDLIGNAKRLGDWLKNTLQQHPRIKRVKGQGLMLGVEFDFPVKDLRSEMIFKKRMFTGDSANPNLIRILPPLNVTREELQQFVDALNDLVK